MGFTCPKRHKKGFIEKQATRTVTQGAKTTIQSYTFAQEGGVDFSTERSSHLIEYTVLANQND